MGFHTDDGRPVPAVTTEEMREVDRVAVDEVGLDLLQMMENAGRTLAATVREWADDDEAVVVLAGNGGNGGGGLCAARHLANHGWTVRVVLDRPPEELTGAAARQHRVLGATDVDVGEATDPVERADLVVDAVVGYGVRGAARGRAAELIEATDAAGRVLSLDVPSGMDATTGDCPGPTVTADRVVTLALPKTGLEGVADLWLADIGIPAGVYERLSLAHETPFAGRSRVRLRSER